MNYHAASYEVSTACNFLKSRSKLRGIRPALMIKVIARRGYVKSLTREIKAQ